MEVVTTRALSCTLEEILAEYQPKNACVNLEAIEATLKKEPTGQFRIPAADSNYELVFNNRELLSRFASLPRERQVLFLGCIRRAMNHRQVMEIHLTATWSAANKRTIKIQQIEYTTGVIFGEGNLSFH